MLISIMSYRSGKFGITATETTNNDKRINTSVELRELKSGLSVTCGEYRVNRSNGVQHVWTYDNWEDVVGALNTVQINFVSDEDTSETKES